MQTQPPQHATPTAATTPLNPAARSIDASQPLTAPTVRYVHGAIVHAPSRGTIEFLPDAFLHINTTSGRIESLHRETQPEDLALLHAIAAEEQTAGSASSSLLVLEPHQFLMPGFVDTHVHAPQYVFAGTATDTPLMQWLTKYTFPVEQAFADLAFAREWYTKLLDRMLAEGITTAQYFATIHVGATQLLADLVEARGQRAFIGLVSMDRNAPETYVSPSTQHALADAEKFVQYALAKQSELVQPVITPRFVPTCSPELLRGLGTLAARYGGLRIQSHAAESRDEEAFVSALHPGQRDTQLFAAAQLLTARTCMAHAVHLTNAELDTFSHAGTSIAHCPLSNFFFANDLLDVDKALQHGVAVGLGTDLAGGYSPSMLRAIQTCVLTAKALEMRDCSSSDAPSSSPSSPQPSQPLQQQRRTLDYKDAFWLATTGGAAALGLEHDTGSFAVGKCFDAIVVDVRAGGHVDVSSRDAPLDVFQKLLHNGDNRNFREVFVKGRSVHQQRP